MRRLRSALRHFARLPRGHAADGRLLGLGLATAMESSRRSAGGDRPVAVPAQRTPR